MKSFVIVAFLAATVYGAQQYSGSERDAPIVSQDQEVNFDGSYRSSYQTGNGIVVQEQGVLKSSKDGDAEEVQGSFQYTAPDGTPISVQYVANENGFQPQGAHLPVPPPVPAAILRALEYIAAHPQPEQQQQRRF